MISRKYRNDASPDYFPFAKHSILLLEYHVPSQLIMSDVLRGLGCRCIHRSDRADAAMAVLRTHQVDLLIADIALAGEDGLAFARRLRASPDRRLAALPILIVSAFTTQAKVIEAVAAGVDGFLAKPVSVGGLAQRVVSTLTQRHQRAERDLVVWALGRTANSVAS